MTSPVLITGGAGFIGSHLAERLSHQGIDVLCLDNFDSYYPRTLKQRNLQPALDSGRAKLVAADVRSRAALDEVFRDAQPETVVHLAGRPGVRLSLSRSGAYFDNNVRGTLNVLRTCAEYGVRRMVFASSSSVYGVVDGPANEDVTVCRPLSPYGASKVAAEALCSAFASSAPMSVVALRFFTVFGPRQRPDMAINRFTRLIAAGQSVPVYGSGASLRDYTFVSDIVDGVEAAMGANTDGYDVINLGRGSPVSLLHLIGLIERQLGRTAQLRHLAERPGDPPSTWADIAKARRILGYDPRVSIEEGVAQYVCWFRQQMGID